MNTRTSDSINLSQDTIYIHAIYWSVVTFSHIGLGDITAITVPERAFNCFVILIYTFAYAILFGNMASLVTDLSANFKQSVFNKRNFVMNFLGKNKIDHFRENVDEFYNYIWKNDTGVDESEVLNEIPSNLKADVRLARYSHI
jgi:hypothetical protein